MTFQIFYWIGWKVSKSQPQPLQPHQKSDISLKDLADLEKEVAKKLKEKEEEEKK